MNRIPTRLSKSKIIKLLGIAVLLLIQCACGQATGTGIVPPSEPPPVTTTPTPTTSPTHTPPTGTPTPAPPPTPERPELTGGEIPYTTEQARLIGAGHFIHQEEALQQYYQYWLGADPENRLVYPLSTDQQLNIEYIFDPANPTQACLDIPATGYENADVLAVPYRSGEPQSVAPAGYANGQIETGQGPLILTKSGQSSETGQPYVLSCENGFWVRRDAAGAVMDRINQQNQWEVDAGWLAGRFGLNPDHRYQLTAVRQDPQTVTKYLQDVDNRGLMLQYFPPNPETGQPARWEAPPLETMYGHLVPEDQQLQFRIHPGDLILDSAAIPWQTCYADPRYQNISLLTTSTGNVRIVREFNPALDKEVIVVYGEGLYRANGVLQIIRERLDVVDPDQQNVNVLSCWDEPAPSNLCDYERAISTGDISANTTHSSYDWTIDQITEFWRRPGRLITLVINFEHPDTPPPLFIYGHTHSNIRDLANWYSFNDDSEPILALINSLRSGSGANPNQDYIYPAAQAIVHLTTSEAREAATR